jgi:hypothetical protein
MTALAKVGAILILLKILVHIYIKSYNDPSYRAGPGGHFLEGELFLPVFDELEKNKWLKVLCNLLYTTGLAMVAIFLVYHNLNKK